MQFRSLESLVNPQAAIDVNAIGVSPSKFHGSGYNARVNSKQQKPAAASGTEAGESESLQIFMDALFTGLRDDPAAIASVARVSREIDAAHAAARAAAGACPNCGALQQHQRKDF